MLPTETTKALMEWKLITARLITAKFYGTITNIRSSIKQQEFTRATEAPGSDGIPAEVLKADKSTSMQLAVLDL